MRHSISSPPLSLALLIAFSLGTLLPAAESGPVRAELVPGAARIAPGSEFLLGLRLTMDEGWHSYWRNPGDSGLPTRLQIELPEGFEVGPLAWPLPRSFGDGGGLSGYGYAGEVLHWVRVRAPRALTPGSEVPLTARIRWLACKELCLPGQAEFQTTLPVGETFEAANRETFEAWQARLPEPAPPEALEARLLPGRDSGQWRLELTAPADLRLVEVFPEPSEGYFLENLEWQPGAPESRLDFTLTATGAPPEALDFLVTCRRAGEERLRGFLLHGLALP